MVGLIVAVVVAVAVMAVAGYVGVVTGALVLDTGWGRRLRSLGPLSLEVSAARATVYTLLTQPYLGKATRALADKVQVVERGADLVLAAHRTPLRGGLIAVTVEVVRFTPDQRIDFRLLRGPVPYVVEAFTLADTAGGCRLDYQGELGTDFGVIGAWWGRIVAKAWRATVWASMRAVKAEAERRRANPAGRPPAGDRPGGTGG